MFDSSPVDQLGNDVTASGMSSRAARHPV
jgi:hypothetical protein